MSCVFFLARHIWLVVPIQTALAKQPSAVPCLVPFQQLITHHGPHQQAHQLTSSLLPTGSDYVISGNLSPDLGFGMFGVRRMGSKSQMALYTSQFDPHNPVRARLSSPVDREIVWSGQ